jgi:hypothetical protein
MPALFDGNCFAAFAFDLGLECLEALSPPRYQRNYRAIVRQCFGELSAKAAGRAGHQRNPAFEAEHFGGLHAVTLYTCEAST